MDVEYWNDYGGVCFTSSSLPSTTTFVGFFTIYKRKEEEEEEENEWTELEWETWSNGSEIPVCHIIEWVSEWVSQREKVDPHPTPFLYSLLFPLFNRNDAWIIPSSSYDVYRYNLPDKSNQSRYYSLRVGKTSWGGGEGGGEQQWQRKREWRI